MDNATVIVGTRAFSNVRNLKSLSLSENVCQIEEEAFADSSLEEIDLTPMNQLLQLPRRAFIGCGSLESVKLPDGLTTIGDECFLYCYCLVELDIPDSVNKIGSDAFEDTILLIVGKDSPAEKYAKEEGLAYRLRNAAVIPAEKVVVDKTSLTLAAGTGYTLSAEIYPAEATDSVNWSSDDPSILRVDDGFIRPLKKGETEITVWAGGAKTTVPVRVVESTIEIEQEPTCVLSGRPLQLTVKNIPVDNIENTTDLHWSCDGASIDGNGLLSATDSGIAAVRVRTSNGSVAQQRFACINMEDALSLPNMLGSIGEELFRNSDNIKVIPRN